MQTFEAIDLSSLVTVTGGAEKGESNAGGLFTNGAGRAKRVYARGRVTVDPKIGLKVTGEGEYAHALSPYGVCMDKLPDNPTTEQIEACGKLAGAQ